MAITSIGLTSGQAGRLARLMRDFHHIHLAGHTVLDGGLATELEQRGHNLSGPLWSAKLLATQPEAILGVHRAYMQAGADILLTAGYQVSSLAFQHAGLHAAEAAAAAAQALRASVQLAVQARAAAALPGMLIAASLGPYGAALANGAEFHGVYGFADDAEEHAVLRAFHAERIALLAPGEADLLAFETIPSLAELRAIVAALADTPTLGAWLSFTCRDDAHIAHGESLAECAALLDSIPQILAIGINCTAPRFVLSLLGKLRAHTTKPVIVYPNSGEGWDAHRRAWTGTPDVAQFQQLAAEWFAAGAQAVGGCCRTGPAHIRAVASVAPGPPGSLPHLDRPRQAAKRTGETG